MRETFTNIGISIASNTALFTGLDVGQWIADKFSLGALAANLLAALIATAFPLALIAASRMFKLDWRAGGQLRLRPSWDAFSVGQLGMRSLPPFLHARPSASSGSADVATCAGRSATAQA